MKTKIRATSLLAFSEIIPTLGERQMQVFKKIREIQPCSNLEISRSLNLPINSITPRCQELRKMGLVVMDRIDICKYTNRKVIYWRIKKWITEILA